MSQSAIARTTLIAGFISIGIAFLFGSLASAADGPPSAAGSPANPPCERAEARQFDFWLGEWDVYEPNGEKAGVNRINKILGGCAIQENWSGTGGTTGTSLNLYVNAKNQWHQTWVDNSGGLLQLDGEFRNGKMVLAGETPTRDKPRNITRHRITWEPVSGGKVRQLWEASEDGGKAWQILFDGMYVPKKNATTSQSRAWCGVPGSSCRAIY
jgi:hypothetical protein